MFKGLKLGKYTYHAGIFAYQRSYRDEHGTVHTYNNKTLRFIGRQLTALEEGLKRAAHVLGIREHQLDLRTIEVSGADSRDYPKFCDAYIEVAYWDDGTQLTDEECDKATEECADTVNQMALESFY